MTATEPQSLSSRVIKTEQVNWKQLQFLQNDQFKDISIESFQKLKKSLIANKFSQPFYVWQSEEGIMYCLDGFHRVKALKEIGEFVQVPKLLPATFIECVDRQEAASLVLIYSSLYAKASEAGLYDFMEVYNLSFETLKEQIDLPSIDLSRFGGDLQKDFSMNNKELDIETFENEVILKLSYSKQDYLVVKRRLNEVMNEMDLETPEEVIKKLLLI